MTTLAEGWAGFMGQYPWITANCGDIDITGFRLSGVVLEGDRVGPS